MKTKELINVWRDWIDTVPSKSIPMRNLFQRYTIIGL